MLAQARVYVDESGERLYVPELDRLEGEIQLMCDGEHAAAEASFRRAIEGASRAGEKLLELRAAVRLGALYRDLGRSEEALRLVGDVLATFPQATDARDVRRARELIAG
ncbi:tetratricopeptide repeat protein [Sorangium sp. So ce185]|uniref:tetratricopeptide repeat protein n=1 Tax=Sorangium sp. So ce185 TaxID=3133287 RepID=UPI003F6157F2